MNLLLLSSSRVGTTAYLEHAKNMIAQHLSNGVKEVLFIPYAGIAVGFDQYEKMVSSSFNDFGYKIKSIHHAKQPKQAIEKAQAIAIGGGNTFSLLNSLYQYDLIEAIKHKVKNSIPYIGWSAGSNIAAPTICTTNDMPIVQPPSFNALSLIPFQINPHYIDGNPQGHNGETREQRINEFLLQNPKQVVIGIPEGSALKLKNNKLKYLAQQPGFKFSQNHGKQIIKANSDLSYLL